MQTWTPLYFLFDIKSLSLSDAGDVLQWLAGNSSKSLDIIAQYWQLLAQPKDPRSGDFGYSEADLERFGANKGREVYKSLENAADRMVDIR